MKQIKCEMCGSIDLIKKDDIFVCQYCGLKYTAEEVKKMVVEVKLDSTEKVNNWLSAARKYRLQSDFQNSLNYYNLVLQEKPNDWESYFYSTVYSSYGCKNYEIGMMADKVSGILLNTVNSINADESTTNKEDALLMISGDVLVLANYLLKAQTAFYKEISGISGSDSKHVHSMKSIKLLCYNLGTMLSMQQRTINIISMLAKAFYLGSNISETYGYLIADKQTLDSETQSVRAKTKEIINEYIEGFISESEYIDRAKEMAASNQVEVLSILVQKMEEDAIKYIGLSIEILQQKISGKNEDAVLENIKKASRLKTQVPDVLKYLINVIGLSNVTILQVCVAKCSPVAVNYLVDNGADVNRTGDGVIPLWYVSQRKFNNNNEARIIAKKLLDNGSITSKMCNGIYILNNFTDPEIHAMILAKDPDTIGVKNQGGCYIATAVYGSYDCPQVWTLRRYRDDYLASKWHGRLFIHTYYAISPTLVKWFGHMTWFKKIWRGKLDHMVKNLQDKGYESTPYKDKKW